MGCLLPAANLVKRSLQRVKFSLIPGVVVMLKKLPCPDNLKLIP